MKKILLVEDDGDIRNSIKEYLELENYIVDTASDGEIGLDKALQNKYDLILLDLMLPEIDGLTIASKLSRKIKTPIIMLTAKDSIDDKLKGFDKGAIDYIVKPFDLRELEVRIKVALKINNTTEIVEIGDLSISFEKREFIKSGKKINITTKEYLIFEFLFKNSDKLSTRTDIIEYVWGGDSLFDADAKLDVYISNLRRKLGKSIIETTKGVGYKINI